MTQEIICYGPVRPLTVAQVDWSLFGKEASRVRRDYIEPGEVLRWDFASQIFQIQKNLQKEPNLAGFKTQFSDELKIFLAEHRPQTLFFAPQDIASILTSDSDIVADHQKTEELEKWQFRLNPQRFEMSDDPHDRYRRQITLTRGKVDKYDRPEPYLVVEYVAKYSEPDIIFTHDYGITWGDILPRPELEKAMSKLLGITEYVVEQLLKFEVTREAEKEHVYFDGVRVAKVYGSMYQVRVSLSTNF